MIFTSKVKALSSLREFSKEVKAAHSIVRFWSNTQQRWLYTRVYGKR